MCLHGRTQAFFFVRRMADVSNTRPQGWPWVFVHQKSGGFRVGDLGQVTGGGGEQLSDGENLKKLAKGAQTAQTRR